MDKGLLFQFMRVKFREAGFSEAEIELHMQSLAERYQNKSDEEIEADIKRRGGASRMASATVERRNTVLMADPDYRAFALSSKDDSSSQDDSASKDDSASQDNSAEPETAGERDMSSAIASADENTADTLETGEDTADDPLAAWFSDSAEKTPAEAELPPLFAEQKTDVQTEGSKPANHVSDTAQIPAVKPAAVKTSAAPAEKPAVQNPQTVHSIPLFGDAGQGQQTPPRAPMTPRPGADLGSTRLVHTSAVGASQTEQAAKPASAPKPQPRSAGGAYQEEQRAIWASHTGVTDGMSAPARRMPPAEQDTPHPAVHNRAQTQKSAKPKVEYADRGNVTWLQEKTYWGEGSEEGVKRFRIVLALAAIPAAILLLAYAVLALGLIVLMPVLMGVFVLGLVVEVAVGSLVALVAVIYGVSQLFIVVPIGMFELGLGVAAIGITMFVGILMYNIAVRLLPFLLRQFIRFQSVFKGFLQDLYYYVKGECYRR